MDLDSDYWHILSATKLDLSDPYLNSTAWICSQWIRKLFVLSESFVFFLCCIFFIRVANHPSCYSWQHAENFLSQGVCNFKTWLNLPLLLQITFASAGKRKSPALKCPKSSVGWLPIWAPGGWARTSQPPAAVCHWQSCLGGGMD